jgi:mannose-1-phosphate guanylyltransferase/mannose-6-phosphate isomerase
MHKGLTISAMSIENLTNPEIQVTPVILCGGSGTRLWPLSRSGLPKQFLVLFSDESNQSLFQQAIQRINALGVNGRGLNHTKIGSTLIVTNEEHRFLALDQLRELQGIDATLLLEPVGRNTAPALTLAAFEAQNVEEGNGNIKSDPILVVTPADQAVQNQVGFVGALQDCVAVVCADNSKQTIVILGITPTAPEIGYGYIKRNSNQGIHGEYLVDKFVEKPDVKTAEGYLIDGLHLWNSGMFVMRASTWLAALNEFRPDILVVTERSWVSRTVDEAGQSKFIRPDKDIFKTIPSESIDYAVIEKCSESSKFDVKMIELNAGWSDLGAWDAVWQMGEQDEHGNVTTGDVITDSSKNSLIFSSSRLVSTVGVDSLIIVETADAVLVADRKKSQDVKYIVNQLEQQKREEKALHRKVVRPWGWYDSIDEGEGFKVKRIQVKPGASLSLQMHHQRAEHWIVVKGTAEITNGNQVITLSENQSTYIPKGQIHRLVNPGRSVLEIIEVQSGGYLGEDDIVRFEDTYGRS